MSELTDKQAFVRQAAIASMQGMLARTTWLITMPDPEYKTHTTQQATQAVDAAEALYAEIIRREREGGAE